MSNFKLSQQLTLRSVSIFVCLTLALGQGAPVYAAGTIEHDSVIRSPTVSTVKTGESQSSENDVGAAVANTALGWIQQQNEGLREEDLVVDERFYRDGTPRAKVLLDPDTGHKVFHALFHENGSPRKEYHYDPITGNPIEKRIYRKNGTLYKLAQYDPDLGGMTFYARFDSNGVMRKAYDYDPGTGKIVERKRFREDGSVYRWVRQDPDSGRATLVVQQDRSGNVEKLDLYDASGTQEIVYVRRFSVDLRTVDGDILYRGSAPRREVEIRNTDGGLEITVVVDSQAKTFVYHADRSVEVIRHGAEQREEVPPPTTLAPTPPATPPTSRPSQPPQEAGGNLVSVLVRHIRSLPEDEFRLAFVNLMTRVSEQMGLHRDDPQYLRDLDLNSDGTIDLDDYNQIREQLLVGRQPNISVAPVLDQQVQVTRAVRNNKRALVRFPIDVLRSEGEDPFPPPLTYSIRWLSPEPESYVKRKWDEGFFHWWPTYEDQGRHEVEVCASDGRASDCEQVQIDVRAEASPVLDPVQPNFVRAGETVSFTLKGRDPDGGNVRYAITNLPLGARFDPRSGVFAWTSTKLDVGNYVLEAKVIDNEGNEYVQPRWLQPIIEIYDRDAVLPLIPEIDRVTVTAGTVLDFTPDVIVDPNVTYFYAGLPKPWYDYDDNRKPQNQGLPVFTVDHTTGRIRGQTTEQIAGTHEVTLVAQNARGLKSARPFVLEVLPAHTVCLGWDGEMNRACGAVGGAFEQGSASGNRPVTVGGETYVTIYAGDGHSVVDPNLFPQMRTGDLEVSVLSYEEENSRLLRQDDSVVASSSGYNDFLTDPHHTLALFNYSVPGSMTPGQPGGGWTEGVARKYTDGRKSSAGMERFYIASFTANELSAIPIAEDYQYRDHPDIDAMMGNIPYHVNAVGRSFHDKPFMTAAMLFSAALSPELKARILKGGYFVPTFQMALRLSMKNVNVDPAIYRTGEAHPVAFRRIWIGYEDLVRIATELNRLNDIPPIAQVSVVSDTFDEDEVLYTTPGAVGRVWRGVDRDGKGYMKSIIVDGRASFDPEGEAVTYEWIVLQGKHPDLKITPLNREGSIVRIDAPYQNLRTEIGLFASTANGQISTPAIISLSNEVVRAERDHRVYENGRLVERKPANVAWERDVYHYGEANGEEVIVGFTREYADGSRYEYTADGSLRVISRDETGRVREARRVTLDVGHDYKYREQVGAKLTLGNEVVDGQEVAPIVRVDITDPSGGVVLATLIDGQDQDSPFWYVEDMNSQQKIKMHHQPLDSLSDFVRRNQDYWEFFPNVATATRLVADLERTDLQDVVVSVSSVHHSKFSNEISIRFRARILSREGGVRIAAPIDADIIIPGRFVPGTYPGVSSMKDSFTVRFIRPASAKTTGRFESSQASTAPRFQTPQFVYHEYDYDSRGTYLGKRLGIPIP